MDEDLRQRITRLEQHVDWLYAERGLQGPYGTVYGQPLPDPDDRAGHGAGGHANSGTTQAADGGSIGVSAAVQAYLEQDQVIRAIKQYRSETGAGLKEAKDVVDAAYHRLTGR